MAKSTKPTPTEEELAALAAEQAAADMAASEEAPTEEAPTEEAPAEDIPVVEEAPTGWQGHSSRAYRSFAVPYGAAVAESVNPVADGQQEEPEV